MNQGLKIEQKVRDILGKELGKSLSKKKLVVGYRTGGEPIYHEFDFVSDDKETIGEVKSDKYTSEKAYTTTRRWRLLGACFYLQKVNAKTKLLVLTNKQLYLRFMKDMDGLLDIAIRNIPVK